MPFEIYRDDEHPIIWVRIMPGRVTWAAYHEATDKVIDMVKGKQQVVSIIIDAQIDLPPGNPVPHLRLSCTKMMAVEEVHYVISVANFLPLARMFLTTVYRIFKIDTERFLLVDTIEDALKIVLADVDKRT